MTVHVTRAADGEMRRAFTIADVERMVEAGIIDESERFELIGGEIVPMSPKGITHERLKGWLVYELVQKLPSGFRTIPETTFRLNDDTFLEPDFVVFPDDLDLAELGPGNAVLAIEIAVSSLSYDLGRKAQVYAGFGVAELWVIDVAQRQTVVHRHATPMGYRDVVRHSEEVVLKPSGIPDFSLTLGDYA
ncbi:MAG: Uma2 family endonuclease [Pseudomonadota bacterium]